MSISSLTKLINDDIANGGCTISKITRRNYSNTFDFEEVYENVIKVAKLNEPKFSMTPQLEFVYKNFINWVLGQQFECFDAQLRCNIKGNQSKGLYIAGQTGVGKTYMTKIIRYVVRQMYIYYDYAGKSIPLIWKSYRSDEILQDYAKNGDYVKYVRDIPVLCIQDLGSEQNEGVYMGNRVEVIRHIIEARGDQDGLITMVTSNFPIYSDNLLKKYGDRCVSRLYDMCNYFEIRGEDNRKKN